MPMQEYEGTFKQETYIIKSFIVLFYFSTATMTGAGFGDIYPTAWCVRALPPARRVTLHLHTRRGSCHVNRPLTRRHTRMVCRLPSCAVTDVHAQVRTSMLRSMPQWETAPAVHAGRFKCTVSIVRCAWLHAQQQQYHTRTRTRTHTRIDTRTRTDTRAHYYTCTL